MREPIKELELENAPRDAIEAQARQFVEQWSDIGQLFDYATLEEQRVILQHLIEIVKLQVTVRVEKTGTSMLGLFPEIGPLLPDDGNKPVKGHQISRPQETKNRSPEGENRSSVNRFGVGSPIRSKGSSTWTRTKNLAVNSRIRASGKSCEYPVIS